MKTINNFNKENLKQFREELQRTLTEFAKQRGIEKMNMGTIRFDGNECRFKVEAQIKRPVGGLTFVKNQTLFGGYYNSISNSSNSNIIGGIHNCSNSNSNSFILNGSFYPKENLKYTFY